MKFQNQQYFQQTRTSSRWHFNKINFPYIQTQNILKSRIWIFQACSLQSRVRGIRNEFHPFSYSIVSLLRFFFFWIVNERRLLHKAKSPFAIPFSTFRMKYSLETNARTHVINPRCKRAIYYLDVNILYNAYNIIWGVCVKRWK